MKKAILFLAFVLLFVSVKAYEYGEEKSLYNYDLLQDSIGHGKLNLLTNVSSMDVHNISCLGIVNYLSPKQYYYDLEKDPTLPSNLQFGFLAQDLLQVIPNVVLRDEKGYLVDYEQIIAINTGAIKTLHSTQLKNAEIHKRDIERIKELEDRYLYVLIISICSLLSALVFYLLSMRLLKNSIDNYTR